MTYSNPRTKATIDNWPSGSRTVTAQFSIERHPTRGERAVRVTTGKPKTLTFARKVRIVDGDDGRIYLAELSKFSNHISIMRGTMDYQQEFIGNDDPRHAELLTMFDK
jgi:hypothetical protein